MLSDFADSQDLSKQKLNLVILFPLNAEKINTNLDKELKDTGVIFSLLSNSFCCCFFLS